MRIELAGRTAVVTGAASGIGRATALSLAARSCNLALVDRNVEGLAETANAARRLDVTVSTHQLDLLDGAAIAALPAEVLAQHARVEVLINNAGAALVGTFMDVTLDEFRWLIDTNFWSVVAMTKAFLPTLLEADAAQIVNISSLFGIIAPAYQTAYASSKFAVRGFSESLRHELARTQVGVTVVHPGGVNTMIAKSARVAAAMDADRAAQDLARRQVLLRMPAEKAGEIIVAAIERRAKRLLIGSDARSIDLLQRLLPASYWPVLTRVFARLLTKER